MKNPKRKPFCIRKWQKIDILYPSHEENNAAVVFIANFTGNSAIRKRCYFLSLYFSIQPSYIGSDKSFIFRKSLRANWMCYNYSLRNSFVCSQVTVELKIPGNYISPKPPTFPFFGKVLDKRYYFGAHIDEIRGHIIEVDIKRIRNEKNISSWDIISVLLKVYITKFLFCYLKYL